MGKEDNPLITDFKKIGRIIYKYKFGSIGFVVISTVIVISLFAEYFSPFDPYAQELKNRLTPPFWSESFDGRHLLGTDMLGRDVLSRVIYGARVSLSISFPVVMISCFIGTAVGLLGGYFPGKTDFIVRLLINIRLAFPRILIVLGIVAVLGPGIRNMIIALILTSWDPYAVVIRGEVIALRKEAFVEASTVIGGSHIRIIMKHILPNVLNSLLVVGTLEIAHIILTETGLSFLGLGVQPPTPSLGGMLSDARSIMFYQPWLAMMPGAAIFMITLSINLVGDGLRDIFDPKI
jgi:peptide/nickel transport system permease protein